MNFEFAPPNPESGCGCGNSKLKTQNLEKCQIQARRQSLASSSREEKNDSQSATSRDDSLGSRDTLGCLRGFRDRHSPSDRTRAPATRTRLRRARSSVTTTHSDALPDRGRRRRMRSSALEAPEYRIVSRPRCSGSGDPTGGGPSKTRVRLIPPWRTASSARRRTLSRFCSGLGRLWRKLLPSTMTGIRANASNGLDATIAAAHGCPQDPCTSCWPVHCRGR